MRAPIECRYTPKTIRTHLKGLRVRYSAGSISTAGAEEGSRCSTSARIDGDAKNVCPAIGSQHEPVGTSFESPKYWVEARLIERLSASAQPSFSKGKGTMLCRVSLTRGRCG